MAEWQVIQGDCLHVLRGMPDASVDAVVTDPPYGTGAWKRAEAGAGADCRAEHQLEEWDKWDTRWLDEAWRVSREHRVAFFCAMVNLPSIFTWCGNRPWRMFAWAKSDPRPRFGQQPSFGFECIVCIGGYENIGGADWVSASAPRLHRDVDGTGHPHQKPIEAVQWVMDLACKAGASVLDPFAGSGTTGVACVQGGRRFIGIEQDPKWCQVARRRIADAVPLFSPHTSDLCASASLREELPFSVSPCLRGESFP